MSEEGGYDKFEEDEIKFSKNILENVYDIVEKEHKYRCSMIGIFYKLDIIPKKRRDFGKYTCLKSLHFTQKSFSRVFNAFEKDFGIKIGFFFRFFCKKETIKDLISIVENKLNKKTMGDI